MRGKGVPVDLRQAAAGIARRRNRETRTPSAAWGTAMKAARAVEQNWEEAVKWYRAAAEQGLASAQCNLAWCYEYGKGVEQDSTAAAAWYRRAAEQGEARGMFCLGVLYRQGSGVEKDPAAAAMWYQKAVDAGSFHAMCNLGVCYEYGRGRGAGSRSGRRSCTGRPRNGGIASPRVTWAASMRPVKA